MSKLVLCYNKGCGKKFNPNDNKENDCRHHPGEPFFHDAYKGWTCCKKKCIDFTQFLNIEGCALSQHSNVKPVEPEKPKSKIVEIPEQPINIKPKVVPLERPPFDTEMTVLTPELAPSLKQQLNKITGIHAKKPASTDEIPIGTHCANGGCSATYTGTDVDYQLCLHHPGTPIFHEGLKFWSCCQRKTSNFETFLNQEGCKEGRHFWKTDSGDDGNKVDCRWDYHQTGPFVVVSIYAKEYCPKESLIKINPIRLYVNLIFPKQNNGNFELDIELSGIIDVSQCVATMYGTKVEIKLRKVEGGQWSKLEAKIVKKSAVPKVESDKSEKNLIKSVDAVDLSDL